MLEREHVSHTHTKLSITILPESVVRKKRFIDCDRILEKEESEEESDEVKV